MNNASRLSKHSHLFWLLRQRTLNDIFVALRKALFMKQISSIEE